MVSTVAVCAAALALAAPTHGKPTRARVAHPTAGDLEAFGVPVADFERHWADVTGANTMKSPVADRHPGLGFDIAAAAHRVVQTMAMPTDSTKAEICVPPITPLNTSAFCHDVTCVLCVNQSILGQIYNATCQSVVDGKAFVSPAMKNASNALIASLSGLLEKMDASPAHLDCACTAQSYTVQDNCTWTAAQCIYYVPAGPGASPSTPLVPLVRDKGWRAQYPSLVGASRGWENPVDGYPQANAGDAATAALLDVLGTHPEARCNADIDMPPLVVVPGLTSSSINYKLDNSAPPWWAFWCNHTTNGEWEPLWPVSYDLAAQPNVFLCWAANIEVKFDPTSQSFRPLRDGETTELVDFGNFSGITGLSALLPYYAMTGWLPGKNLFAAPFDWRVPSSGQAEFFANLKALIEQAYATNGGSKVVLWAYSFGPQYALSFLHRMTQEWKDQYIAWFVATSPVWSGSPAALAAFATGYVYTVGQPPLHPPKECANITLAEGACYTGAVQQTLSTDLGGCCSAVALSGGSGIFNYYTDNKTCAIMAAYQGTESCQDGILGYKTNAQAATIDPHTTALAAPPPSPPNPSAGLVTLFIRTAARGSPAFIWAFPRGGTDPKTT
mmetsp:Transcript_325/g.1049  ORF Transcript_325/g.1049 Transcript_325/m.1049 type:complete len:614 (-) Transcript_325:819-2660(-)